MEPEHTEKGWCSCSLCKHSRLAHGYGLTYNEYILKRAKELGLNIENQIMNNYGFGGSEDDETDPYAKYANDWVAKAKNPNEPRCTKDGLISTGTMTVEQLLASCGMKEEF